MNAAMLNPAPAARTILIMAAGTGGHVYPGLAIAKELALRGWRIAWLGTPDGLENKLVAEAGYPQFQSTLWFGFAVPAQTPQPIVARLHRAIVVAVSNPEVTAHFARLAVQPKSSAAPDDFRRFIDSELVRWRKVVEAIEGPR